MPGAVLGQGVSPESETVFGLRIGPTIVSGLREAPFASAWAGPRVHRWFDSICCLIGWLGLCRGTPAVRGPAVLLEFACRVV